MSIIERYNYVIRWVLYTCVALPLVGCGFISNRLDNIGKKPNLNNIDVKPQQTAYDQPMDVLATAHLTNRSGQDNIASTRNSLWRPGSRSFFRDQRARSVGDILKVKITIQDQAKLDNKTEKRRTSQSGMGVPNLFGMETKISDVLPDKTDPKNLLKVTGSANAIGDGKIDRKETINTTIAATVIRVLPSNNLLIKGSQEIRVNYELREVTVEGIVRPEDINTDNSVTLDQVAEARISYGGRGQLTDVQQERYGHQLVDALSPF